MTKHYGAWNKKSKVWVKWLSYANSKKLMDKRIRKYSAPEYVVSRGIPKSSEWF